MRAREKTHFPRVQARRAYSANAVLPTESKAAFRKFHRQFRKNLNTMLRSETVGRLLEKYGKVDFKSLPTTLANAVKQALESREGEDQVEDESTVEKSKLGFERKLAIEEWVDELREEFDVWREVGDAGTLEGLNKELDVRERLDSAITRSLKQLLMVRGIKSISAPPASSSPKQIPRRLKAA
ncbi:MAG TPA: hypothetical protein VGJ76_13040 [Pseudolabrys sp.]|jgi:hypothetical protein